MAIDPLKQIPQEPIPATIGDGFTFASAGDIIGPFRPEVPLSDPGLEAVCDLLRSADVSMANHEGSYFDIDTFTGYRAAENGGGYPIADAVVAQDLKQMGIDVVSKANNHATDWGVEGLLATRKALSAAGVAHAGSGPSKAAARAAAYIETPKGRIAVISAASTYTPMSEAGDADGEVGPRPGISIVRNQAITQLPRQQMKAVYDIAAKLHIGPWIDSRVTGNEKRIRIGQETFEESDKFRLTYKMDARDHAEILRSIRASKQVSDFVAFTLHGHESESGLGEDRNPADFHRTLFHHAIQAGADLVTVTGPHTLRGIEIFQGKPIFYGLGSLFLELEDDRGPNLDRALAADINPLDYTPAEYIQSVFQLPDSWYDSAIAVTQFQDGKASEIRIHPLRLTRKSNFKLQGSPRIADSASAERIIRELTETSTRFGTKIAFENGIGVIRLKPGE